MLIPGKWVPRSPSHRAEATRQVEYDRRGWQRTDPLCESRHTSTWRRRRADGHGAAPLQESSRGQPRPADRPRQLVPASRARRGAHARGRLHGVRAARRPPTRSSSTQIVSRLHLVPRYRQRLAFVPFDQGRPVWVDDPHFNVTYHVRHTALPRPGGDEELKRLAGRVFSQALDRAAPAVGAVAGRGARRRPLCAALQDPSCAGRRRLGRRHRDGAVRRLARSDAGRAARAGVGRRVRCRPRRSCSPTRCVERATVPARDRSRRPRDAARARARSPRELGEALVGVGALAWAGLQAAPPSPFNVRIGPHRRFTWVRGDLARVQGDQELARRDRQRRRAGGRRRRARPLHAPARRTPTDGRRAQGDGAGLGPRRRRARRARQPGRGDVGAAAGRDDRPGRAAADDQPRDGGHQGVGPGGRRAGADRAVGLRARRRSWRRRRGCRPASGCSTWSSPTSRARSSRCTCSAASSRPIYPMVPLAENTALGIAIMSYNGQLNFGLTADYDALADVEALADELRSLDRGAGGGGRSAAGAGGRPAARHARPAQRARPVPRPARVKLADHRARAVAIVVASLLALGRPDRACSPASSPDAIRPGCRRPTSGRGPAVPGPRPRASAVRGQPQPATTQTRRPAARTFPSPCSATRRDAQRRPAARGARARQRRDHVRHAARRRPACAALALSVAGPFSPALAAAGQAVILARRPGTTGLIGLAWTRMRARSPRPRTRRCASSPRSGWGAASPVGPRPPRERPR